MILIGEPSSAGRMGREPPVSVGPCGRRSPRCPRPARAATCSTISRCQRTPQVLDLIKLSRRTVGVGGTSDAVVSSPVTGNAKVSSHVYGRMAWDDVAPTITSGCINPSKGRYTHPEQDRAITLREAALLQGFTKRYSFSLRRGKYAVAEMIGNALPPIRQTARCGDATSTSPPLADEKVEARRSSDVPTPGYRRHPSTNADRGAVRGGHRSREGYPDPRLAPGGEIPDARLPHRATGSPRGWPGRASPSRSRRRPPTRSRGASRTPWKPLGCMRTSSGRCRSGRSTPTADSCSPRWTRG